MKKTKKELKENKNHPMLKPGIESLESFVDILCFYEKQEDGTYIYNRNHEQKQTIDFMGLSGNIVRLLSAKDFLYKGAPVDEFTFVEYKSIKMLEKKLKNRKEVLNSIPNLIKVVKLKKAAVKSMIKALELFGSNLLEEKIKEYNILSEEEARLKKLKDSDGSRSALKSRIKREEEALNIKRERFDKIPSMAIDSFILEKMLIINESVLEVVKLYKNLTPIINNILKDKHMDKSSMEFLKSILKSAEVQKIGFSGKIVLEGILKRGEGPISSSEEKALRIHVKRMDVKNLKESYKNISLSVRNSNLWKNIRLEEENDFIKESFEKISLGSYDNGSTRAKILNCGYSEDGGNEDILDEVFHHFSGALPASFDLLKEITSPFINDGLQKDGLRGKIESGTINTAKTVASVGVGLFLTGLPIPIPSDSDEYFKEDYISSQS